MNEDLLGYNEMVEHAMRSVVRQALDRAATTGLPGDHHFYITFRTDHPDTVVPKSLSERYPQEMTIVLQHQFWNLVTDEDGFSVELSFNRKREHLHIPFDALVTFADPSVNFGLQFHVLPADEAMDMIFDEDDIAEELALDDDFEDGELEKKLPSAGKGRRKGGGKDADDSDDDNSAGGDDAGDKDAGGKDAGGDNVVTLDAFRKKT